MYETYSDRALLAENENFREYCHLLETARDDELLCDYAAVLIHILPEVEHDYLFSLMKSQLYDRKMSVGRVDSWYTEAMQRFDRDNQKFIAHAYDEYIHRDAANRKEKAAKKADVQQTKRPRIRPASSFAPEKAAYLIEPYLPRGMLSILGGVSAAGKTSLALDIAAAVSSGRKLPFDFSDSGERAPQNVFYLTAENDPNKVLRPRSEAMGADLEHLYFQEGANLSMNDPELFKLCREYRPALLVFDPIQSFLGPGVQMNRAEQVRPLMDKLIAEAKELDMAVLLISHMSKPGPGVCSALDRLLGSSDFRNSARSILIAGAAPDTNGLRVFAHGKNSLGEPGESQLYHIEPSGIVAYDGPSDLSADRIINAAPEARRTRPAATLNDAVQALDKLVGFVGWVERSSVWKLSAERGFSDATLRRAKAVLGLKVLRLGMQPNQKIFWYRGDMSEDAVRADILGQHEQLPLKPNPQKRKTHHSRHIDGCGSFADIITS